MADDGEAHDFDLTALLELLMPFASFLIPVYCACGLLCIGFIIFNMQYAGLVRHLRICVSVKLLLQLAAYFEAWIANSAVATVTTQHEAYPHMGHCSVAAFQPDGLRVLRM